MQHLASQDLQRVDGGELSQEHDLQNSLLEDRVFWQFGIEKEDL